MKRILIIFLAMLAVAGVSAQSRQPIRWRLSVEMKSTDEGVATVRALVSPGWHLYGMEMPDDGPRPTRISLAEGCGVTPTGDMTASPEAVTVTDPLYGAELTRWDGNVTFTIPFKVTATDATLKVNVAYMGCNDETCLPPSNQTLTYKLNKTTEQ